MKPDSDARGTRVVQSLAKAIGFLVMVEVASGVLQGYYTPIYPQIADHLTIPEGDRGTSAGSKRRSWSFQLCACLCWLASEI